MTFLCNKIIVAKSKEFKTGCNLAESSQEGYGSKMTVLPILMMNTGASRSRGLILINLSREGCMRSTQ
jgi:hypothetical protein